MGHVWKLCVFVGGSGAVRLGQMWVVWAGVGVNRSCVGDCGALDGSDKHTADLCEAVTTKYFISFIFKVKH